MDIKKAIQMQIDVNSGSEKRVVYRVLEDFRASEKDVLENIEWLLKKGYIKKVALDDMEECERRYFESDSCSIIRNIVYYDEMEYYEKERQRREIEACLSNKEKFKLYFSRMEKEFERKTMFNDKNYTLNYGDNIVVISITDESRTIKIDFKNIYNLTYEEPTNSIFYKYKEKYYTIELFYCWGKSNLKHYCRL